MFDCCFLQVEPLELFLPWPMLWPSPSMWWGLLKRLMISSGSAHASPSHLISVKELTSHDGYSVLQLNGGILTGDRDNDIRVIGILVLIVLLVIALIGLDWEAIVRGYEITTPTRSH